MPRVRTAVMISSLLSWIAIQRHRAASEFGGQAAHGDRRRAFVDEKLCAALQHARAEGFSFAFAKRFGHVVLELLGLDVKRLAEEGQGIGN